MPHVAYHPIFVDLRGRHCIVIGGGRVAERKVIMLVKSGAAVTVISPTLTPRLTAYAKRQRIRHRARSFRMIDLRGAWLIYAATDDERVNHAVFRAAQRRRIFANIVDRTALCSFIAPALVQRGPVTIAVSTAGVSPALAKHLRDELAQSLSPRYGQIAQVFSRLRADAKRSLPSFEDRRRYFDRLLQGRVFRLMRAGQFRQANVAAHRLLHQTSARHRSK